jgi:hypothetical protein
MQNFTIFVIIYSSVVLLFPYSTVYPLQVAADEVNSAEVAGPRSRPAEYNLDRVARDPRRGQYKNYAPPYTKLCKEVEYGRKKQLRQKAIFKGELGLNPFQSWPNITIKFLLTFVCRYEDD